MTNRIRQVEVTPHSLIPAEAEVRVLVVPESRDAGTEVRGRLMGPSCRYASTVEVAYHFRPVAGQAGLVVRAIIPEASLWEPESPFLYQGPVELWQDGKRCDTVGLRCGLRSLTLGPRGLRVNGRVLPLRGRDFTSCTEEEALALRAEGYNLLVVPVEAGSEAVWEMADRVGFLVLGRLNGQGPDVLRVAEDVRKHPSCLGWLLPPGTQLPRCLPEGSLLGAEVDESHPRPPEAVQFVVGRAEHLPAGPLGHLVRGSPEGVHPGPGPLLGGIL